MDKLKACKKGHKVFVIDGLFGFSVECDFHCEDSIVRSTVARAIKAWNKRAGGK